MATFHDVQFPTNISLNAISGVEYKTNIVTLRDGKEQRNVEWLDGRNVYDVAPQIASQAELDTLVAFFRARNGRNASFRFKDYLDFEGTAEVLGTGDTSRTQFQMVKNYTSGTYTEIRPITKIVAASETIFLDAVPTGAYTLDDATGILTMNAAPGAGVVVTATYEYDVPVRFETDRLFTNIGLARQYSQQYKLIEDRINPTVVQWTEGTLLDFEEVQLPAEYHETTTGGPSHDTILISSDGGHEDRDARFTESRTPWQFSVMARTKTQMATLLAFFRCRKGRAVGFRFKDISDFELTAEAFGTPDGTTNSFQITKAYASGSQTETRTITKPVAGGQVTIDAAATTRESIDTTTGLVSFTLGSITITYATGPDTLTRSAGSWVTDGVLVGDSVIITDTVSNNATYTVNNVTATVLTVDETVTAEGPIASTVGVPPRTGEVLAFTGEFDIPVRFDTDEFRGQLHDLDIRNWIDASVIEIDIDAIAGQYEAGTTGRVSAGVSGCLGTPFFSPAPIGSVVRFSGASGTGSDSLTFFAGSSSAGRVMQKTMDRATAISMFFVMSNIDMDAASGEQLLNFRNTYTWPSLQLEIIKAGADQGHVRLTASPGIDYESGGVFQVEYGANSLIKSSGGDFFPPFYFLAGSGGNPDVNGNIFVRNREAPFTNDGADIVTEAFAAALTVSNGYVIDPGPRKITLERSLPSYLISDQALGTIVGDVIADMVIFGIYINYNQKKMIFLGNLSGAISPAWPDEPTYSAGVGSLDNPVIGSYHNGATPSVSDGATFDLHEFIYSVHRQRDELTMIEPVLDLATTLNYLQVKYRNKVATPFAPNDLKAWFLPNFGTSPGAPGSPNPVTTWDSAQNYVLTGEAVDNGFGVTEGGANAPNFVDTTLVDLEADLLPLPVDDFLEP